MKIAVIGAGAMGGATVEGLIKGKQFKNADIIVSDPSQAVVEKFAKNALRGFFGNAKKVVGQCELKAQTANNCLPDTGGRTTFPSHRQFLSGYLC